MTEAIKATLETKAIVVQSDFEDTLYCIDRKGRGIHLIVGDNEIQILAENVEAFSLELLDVWNMWKGRVGTNEKVRIRNYSINYSSDSINRLPVSDVQA